MNREDEQEEEYDVMAQLERLESLREDMEALGIRSSQQLEERIRELHARLDEMESESER